MIRYRLVQIRQNLKKVTPGHLPLWKLRGSKFERSGKKDEAKTTKAMDIIGDFQDTWAVAKKTPIWVIFSKVVFFFALLNGSWFQVHAREILESHEIALLSKFRGKVGYVQRF